MAAGVSSSLSATYNVNGDTTPISVTGTYSRSGDGNTCTFSDVVATGGNFSTGSIKITKETVDGDDDFTFTLRDDGGVLIPLNPNTPLSNGEMATAEDLPAGDYTIEESVPTGWELTGVNCGTRSGNTVTVTVVAGEETACTFTNTRQTGSLTIIKQTTGGDDDFVFSLTGPSGGVPLNPNTLSNVDTTTASDLPTGTYTIEETVPDGWELSNVNCGTRNGNLVTVEVGNDDDIQCTFTNFKEIDEPMEEETKRFIYRRVDNLLSHGPDRARILRRLQEQRPTSLKDGPMKFSGQPSTTTLSGAAGSSMMKTGASLSQHIGTNTEQGLPWVDDNVTTRMSHEVYGATAGPTSASSSIFSSIASQLAPVAAGETSFKFGTSLSEVRSRAAEAEARAQQKKLQEAGLSFSGQPNTNSYLAPRPGLDIWAEGQISRYNDDVGGINREGDFRILYVGADYVLAPGILVGALVQIDDTEEDINDPIRSGEIDGTGWMVGPYFGAKLLDNLFFDARAAWGQSDNDIWLNDAAAGFRRGSFDTDRWLATATLTGVRQYGAWRFSPELGLKYGHESYGTYTNSLGQTVRGADANIGRLTGGAEVAYRIQTSNGTIIEPMVGVEGIWNFDSDDLVINGVVQETDDDRAKVEGGVLVTTPSGWGVCAAGNYDGIGGDDFNSYGGSLWVNVPLN